MRVGVVCGLSGPRCPGRPATPDPLAYTGPGRLVVLPPGVSGEDITSGEFTEALNATRARRGKAASWARWGNVPSSKRGAAKHGAILREEKSARKERSGGR